MTSYKDNPEAVRALVQNDRVHRDLYISQEIFELEQEHFFANTWNYVGHESQIPKPGDWLSNEIGGRPIIVVRHTDGIGARDDEPLRAQGLAPGERALRQHRQVLSLPLPRLDLQDRWLAAGDSAQERLRRHAAARVRIGQGPDRRCSHVRSYRGFIFVKINDAGPDFEEYFGDSLSSIDNMADRSPEGELEIAGGCLRFVHQCNWKMFVENLNDTMHPMVAHESSAGTAKRMWADKPAGRAQADGDRAVRALHVRLQVLRGHGHSHLRQRPQLHRRALQHPQQVLGDSRRTTTR